jgi:hypothetical protein
MKKVKIMLASIAILAIVGGALAFKAKYQETICFTDTTLFEGKATCTDPNNNGNPLACATLPGSITDEAHAESTGCTTEPDPFGECPDGCQKLTWSMRD